MQKRIKYFQKKVVFGEAENNRTTEQPNNRTTEQPNNRTTEQMQGDPAAAKFSQRKTLKVTFNCFYKASKDN